jgi:APA family basic amino acid/polyamine antiporter
MNLPTTTAVVIANMIGTGIFTTTGLMLSILESGWMVLACWLLGGVMALAGALSYAELATQMPRAGGEYVFLREIYGPVPAFLSGWTSFFVGFSAPVAASAVALATYLAAAGILPESWAAQKGAAVLAILILTSVHYTGLRLGARVQNALTGLNLALLVGLIAVGFLGEKADWSFLGRESGFWQTGNWGQLATALLWVMFAYSGWNAAAYLGEEVQQPERTLPRSLFFGTITVAGLYLLLNLFLFAAAPEGELRGKVAVAEAAVEHLYGAGAGRWLAVAVSIALVSAVSAFMMIGPRVYYAMARDGLFFSFAGRIHEKFETPSFSILAQGLCAAVMALTGTFADLLTYIGFALGVFPWMTVLGVLVLRRREPERARPYQVRAYPLVPLLYLALMAWVMLVSLVSNPGPPAIALGTIAAGIPAYYWLVRR